MTATAMQEREGTLLRSLAASSRLSEAAINDRVGKNPSGFWPSPPPPLERIGRQGLIHVTRYGHALDVTVTSALKLLRSKASRPLPDPSELPLVQSAPAGKRGVCVISHDVDWLACYRALDWLCAVERKYGVSSTFHFLTEWRYTPDRQRLETMRAEGFEIGLHGRLHDAGFGYRARDYIIADLRRALEKLPAGITAYRAPALCVSNELLSALADVGLRVDSSMLVLNRYAPPAESVWPYEIAPGIIELPLSMQDDLLFRDLRLSDDDALALVTKHMKTIVGAGGVFVFNGHPGILCQHKPFYEGLMAAVNELGCPVMTISQAAGVAVSG